MTDPSPTPPLMTSPPPDAFGWAVCELRTSPSQCGQRIEGHASPSSCAPGQRCRPRWPTPHLRGRSSPPPSIEVGIASASASVRSVSASSTEVHARERRPRRVPATTNTKAVSKCEDKAQYQHLTTPRRFDARTMDFANSQVSADTEDGGCRFCVS